MQAQLCEIQQQMFDGCLMRVVEVPTAIVADYSVRIFVHVFLRDTVNGGVRFGVRAFLLLSPFLDFASPCGSFRFSIGDHCELL